jgi:hypothetical protein
MSLLHIVKSSLHKHPHRTMRSATRRGRWLMCLSPRFSIQHPVASGSQRHYFACINLIRGCHSRVHVYLQAVHWRTVVWAALPVYTDETPEELRVWSVVTASNGALRQTEEVQAARTTDQTLRLTRDFWVFVEQMRARPSCRYLMYRSGAEIRRTTFAGQSARLPRSLSDERQRCRNPPGMRCGLLPPAQLWYTPALLSGSQVSLG